MVIIDDASNDRTSELLAKHLKWRNVTQDKVIVVKSRKNQKPMGSIFYGTHKYCRLGEIQYVVDGDDELIGRQVFKVVNALYQKEKLFTLYSTFVIAAGEPNAPKHRLGKSKELWAQDLQSENFRKTKNRGYSHLRTMMSDTFLLMKPQSLQDEEGKFYWAIADNAMYFPAMEMSCKKIRYLP